MTTARLEQLASVATEVGTPSYVYFLDDITTRAADLRSAMSNAFDLSFAVKSNPNQTLLRHLSTCADSLDISSGGELQRAIAAGWPADKISFTGPAKRDVELIAAIDQQIGEVIVESLTEAQRLSQLASDRGATVPILLRLAPLRVPQGFGDSMAGKPSQFGIDAGDMVEVLPEIAGLPALELKGFHIYSGTQCLQVESIAENYRLFVELFAEASDLLKFAPEKLIFGSGIGIPYYDMHESIDLTRLGELTRPIVARLREHRRLANSRLVLELGRYLVGEAGYFLTQVVDVKHSRGIDMAICDGGLNNHLAATGHFGTVIHRNYRMAKIGTTEGKRRPYQIVGPLCTSIDTLARNAEFPELRSGDVIAILSSGAYGLSASPIYFISHGPPHEAIVRGDKIERADDPFVIDLLRRKQQS